jgi:hypothetical protein
MSRGRRSVNCNNCYLRTYNSLLISPTGRRPTKGSVNIVYSSSAYPPFFYQVAMKSLLTILTLAGTSASVLATTQNRIRSIPESQSPRALLIRQLDLCPLGSFACSDGGCCDLGTVCAILSGAQICESPTGCLAPPVPCGIACCDAGDSCVPEGDQFRCQSPGQGPPPSVSGSSIVVSTDVFTTPEPSLGFTSNTDNLPSSTFGFAEPTVDTSNTRTLGTIGTKSASSTSTSHVVVSVGSFASKGVLVSAGALVIGIAVGSLAHVI